MEYRLAKVPKILKYRLNKFSDRLKHNITLESSKSETNRALVIAALAGGKSVIKNISNARDSQTLQKLLKSKLSFWDVKDAGTTMRFLTAYLAIRGSGQTLTGTDRMKQRPIGPLVNALLDIGADITYMEKEGFPPLEVNRIQEQFSNKISIPGNISSQYISALLMISPCLSNGLTINLTTEVFSRPYIQMTLDLMKTFGVESEWRGNSIRTKSQEYSPATHTIEGDWSGASYWYSFMALAEGKGYLDIPNIRNYSSQGDKRIAEIMFQLGVITQYESGKVRLAKRGKQVKSLTLDFRDCPDLAQTVMVVAAAKGIELEMTGLESLKIKETDRIEAMKNELFKMGALLLEKPNSWFLKPSESLPKSMKVNTYEDHRMAMAFAPLCCKMDVTIEDPKVVDKSYPDFWKEVNKVGVTINSIT
ncbi:MAG: 3-phosphoshikimate 1-carboxyvinyltransferase [Ekhidna sp.]